MNKSSSIGIFISIGLISSILLVSGCVDSSQNEIKNETKIASPQEKTEKYFSIEEVSRHSTKTDCWMAVNGNIYDVTAFIAQGKHPPVIEEGCGRDATRLFETRTRDDGTKVGSGTPHSENAKNILEKYYIGKLSE